MELRAVEANRSMCPVRLPRSRSAYLVYVASSVGGLSTTYFNVQIVSTIRVL